MRKNPVDPGQSDRPDPASRRRLEAHRLRARLTPVRVIVGLLTLALLSLSAIGTLIITTRSYADTSVVPDACTTVTSTPTSGSTTTGGATATATPRHHRTPTATPTDGITPTPTNTPVTPTNTPVTPTPSPSLAPAASIDTPTVTGGVAMLSSRIQLANHVGTNHAVALSAAAQCTPTTTPTGDTQTPDPNSTATTVAPATGTTPTTSTPAHTTGGGSGSSIGLIVGSVFVVLLLGLGAGWFFFRRMLLPQGVPNPNLPPSGARPWARTRAPNPDSMVGMANGQVVQLAFPGGPGGPGNFGPGGPGPNTPPGGPMNNGYNGPGGPPGGNGAGFGGFSDGFIPPSPQIFPQSENSMIPPGSGAFPVITNANGFAPASPAFNAMYGLPDDPFAGSQAGSPGWMANLGPGNGNGFGGPPTPPPNGGNFAPGQVDLNDPYLAEVIRQYSQKSETVQPPQMSPGGPPQQQMPPSRPQQQMPPSRPQQQIPPSRPRPMPLSGPPPQMLPSGPPPQMSPNSPAAPIPQRDPRPGFQDSNWLQ